MKRYSDRNGGLVVEKTEPVAKPKIAETNIQTNSISASDVIDTAISYQVSTFPNGSADDKQGVCLICGKKTAYSNRHFCVDCWKQYHSQMLDGIKNAVADVEIKID